MSYPNPPGPQPDPNSRNPIPTGNWSGVPTPGQAPRNPPKPPNQNGKQGQNVRKLNRATAVAVSLSMVGVLGLGTGIAVASTTKSNDRVADTTQDSGPGTSQGRTIPQSPNDDEDSDSDSDSDHGARSWDNTAPDTNSAPNGGFQVGPPAGGSHGNSGAS